MLVLLIDDDPHMLSTAGRLLEQHGFEVMLHKGAFNATNVIARVQPDLVLLDINMPALSGDQLLPLLSRHRSARHVPVVLFSSNDERSLRATARETGALGYIMKSDMAADFPEKVRRFLATLPSRDIGA